MDFVTPLVLALMQLSAILDHSTFGFAPDAYQIITTNQGLFPILNSDSIWGLTGESA
jgi:hypothetical protein